MVNISAAFLCDFAEVREGLLMAIAAGVTRLWRPRFPASAGVTLALLIDLPQSDLDVPHDIGVTIQGPDNPLGEIKGGFQVGRNPDLKIAETTVAPITIDLRPFQLPAPGSYSINISVDGEFRQTLSFLADLPSSRPV